HGCRKEGLLGIRRARRNLEVFLLSSFVCFFFFLSLFCVLVLFRGGVPSRSVYSRGISRIERRLGFPHAGRVGECVLYPTGFPLGCGRWKKEFKKKKKETKKKEKGNEMLVVWVVTRRLG
ncbi:unnamed protein product, partial [Hapterophycus canaliculatus]